jgi:hypothetical protein
MLKNILVNIRAFFTKNISKEINGSKQRILELESKIARMDQDRENASRNSFCYYSALQYFEQNEQEVPLYASEVEYLRKLGRFCNFPYPVTVPLPQCEAGFDHEAGMPYVVHEGRRLYFPSVYDVEDAIGQYRHLVATEMILKKEDDEPAPHCYQSDKIHLSSDDCLFDIGSAEGLFTLHNIDQVKHVVLVECDPMWFDSLQKTFAPFRDKVDIVKKQVGVEDGESVVTMQTLLAEFASSDAFVKMDIEGGEVPSLLASSAYLASCGEHLKFSVATYHKQNDANQLKELFDRLHFYSEYSKGYMLFNDYDMPLPPYFRHGIIRAGNFAL